MSVQSIYYRMVDEARPKCIRYLNENARVNSPPITWEIKNTENLPCSKHDVFTTEERWGYAIFIFRLCIGCGRGYVECNPPLRVKKVCA